MDSPEKQPNNISSPALNPQQFIDRELSSAPEQGRVPEHLYHANKLFFHATPLGNVDSIIRLGLFATRDRDTLGRNFFYSLTFKSEFNDPGQNRGVLKFGPPKDKFSITLWRASSNIKQTVPHPSKARFSPAAIPTAEVPNEYFWHRIKGVNDSAGEKIRNVPATDFLASLEIDEYIISYFAGAKLGLMFNLVTAGKLIPLAEKFLDGMSTECQLDLRLNNKYTLDNLSKDLIAHLYHEIIIEYSRAASISLEEELSKLHPDHGKIQKIMADLFFKRENAPDALSYKYLNILIAKSVKLLINASLRELIPSQTPDLKNAPRIPIRDINVDAGTITGTAEAYLYFNKAAFAKSVKRYF